MSTDTPQPGPATIQVQRYRDPDGNPTCCLHFGNGEVCRFRMGDDTCFFSQRDREGQIRRMKRRTTVGKQFLIPMPDCPLWPPEKPCDPAAPPIEETLAKIMEGVPPEEWAKLDPPPDIEAMFRELVKFLPGDYGAITVVYVGDCPEDIFVEVRAEWGADDPEVESREFSGATIREALQAVLSAMRPAQAAIAAKRAAEGRVKG